MKQALLNLLDKLPQANKENVMNDFCPFLEDDPLMEGKLCTAGVNFANVGTDRERCRLCPLSNPVNTPLCPNVEVFTFIRNSPEGIFIEAEFDCLANDLPMEERCQSCPDRSGLSMSIPVKEGYLIPIPE